MKFGKHPASLRFNWIKLAWLHCPRFWSKVRYTCPTMCWVWYGQKDKDGYGRFILTAPRGCSPRHRHVRAHRLALMMHLNIDPPAHIVTIHSCDIAACVNPAHLRFGTQAENRADCGSKGRNATGDRSGRRRHPEKFQSGKDHWTHRNPEKVPRGDNWFVGERKNINRRK